MVVFLPLTLFSASEYSLKCFKKITNKEIDDKIGLVCLGGTGYNLVYIVYIYKYTRVPLFFLNYGFKRNVDPAVSKQLL